MGKGKGKNEGIADDVAATIKGGVSDLLVAWQEVKAIPNVDVVNAVGAVLGAVEAGVPMSHAMEALREAVKQGGVPGGRYDLLMRHVAATFRPAGEHITSAQYDRALDLGERFLGWFEKVQAENEAARREMEERFGPEGASAAPASEK